MGFSLIAINDINGYPHLWYLWKPPYPKYGLFARHIPSIYLGMYSKFNWSQNIYWKWFDLSQPNKTRKPTSVRISRETCCKNRKYQSFNIMFECWDAQVGIEPLSFENNKENNLQSTLRFWSPVRCCAWPWGFDWHLSDAVPWYFWYRDTFFLNVANDG